MELTGKAKKDFYKWLLDYHFKNRSGHLGFRFIPNSMKFGVYVDWFDSVGFHININPFLNNEDEIQFYWAFVNDFMIHNKDDNSEFINRNEAQTEAIKKAKERYNEK